MTFVGLKKPEDRAAIIAWLRTQADSEAALPSDAEIASEQAELAPASPDEVTPKDGAPEQAPAEDATKKDAKEGAAQDLKDTKEKGPHDAAPEQGGDAAKGDKAKDNGSEQVPNPPKD
jgi:hypothetical protein